MDECEIVGVVRSVKRNPGTPAETDEQMYVPLAQDPPHQAFITLRTHDEPLTLAKAVRIVPAWRAAKVDPLRALRHE